MSAYEFNLSRYAERLQMAGVPREQALMHAELTAELVQNLVTKDFLKSELAALEERLTERLMREIAAAEARMMARMDAFEARMEARFAKLQSDLFRWLFFAVFVQGGFIVAVLKLFP